MKKGEIMKILRWYQKQTRVGDGKLKPQFPRPYLLSQGHYYSIWTVSNYVLHM